MERTYYVLPDLRLPWEGRAREERGLTEHGLLTDALARYRALPRRGIKSLGAFQGGAVLELARCLPLFPEDMEGEDVLVVPQGPSPAWPAEQVQDLLEVCAAALQVRYYLEGRALCPVPTDQRLPRRLAGQLLWTHQGALRETIRWAYVAGTGWISLAELQRRCQALGDRAPSYPLVLKYRVDGANEQGGYVPLEVAPWEYELLRRRTKEHLENRKES